MKASRFLFRLKSETPNIGNTGATDDDLLALLSEGVDKVNEYAKVSKGYTDFNISAEKQIYQLSESVPTFLGMNKPGVFFKDSSGAWQPVYPKTFTWLAKVYPTFLNAASAALPKWYWQEGDDLGFHNKPSTTAVKGCRIYHLKKSPPMTTADQYPWTGTAVEIQAFLPLDDAILMYARWKLSPAFGANTDQDLRRREFISECRTGAKQCKRRPDLTIDSGYEMQL